MIADTLGFDLDEIADSIEPVVARKEVTTEFLTVRAGQVAGVHQIASGRVKGQERVRLELEMYIGAEDPREEAIIEGEPPLRLVVPGGIPGDPATAAVLVNAIPRVVAAPPGLVTMRDIPAPHP
jgi:4-hydroxy-tetrahydrodipicolinate reductase